jgi:hypothetical protein
MAASQVQSGADAAPPAGARSSLAATPEALALGLTLLFLALRCAPAVLVGLGVDESYTVAVARDLRLSYFDHPPLQYWIVHFAAPLIGRGQVSRIPFLLLFAGTSWLMFRLTRRLFGPSAGVWAVLALNLSGFFTVAGASWVLPDGPLDFWLVAAACVLARGWFGAGPEAPDRPLAPLGLWLAAGACIGLAALSKYQAALFCVGLALFLASAPGRRRELARPGPYAAAIVTLAVLSPVMIWNARNGWASFAFQGARGAPSHGPDLLGLLAAVAGQAGVLTPWVFVPLAAAAARAAAAGPADQRRWFCLMLGAPAIVVFTLAPLVAKHTLPHWASPGWLLLFPLAGDGLARAAETRAWPKIWAAASATALILLGAVFTSDAASGWIGPAFSGLAVRSDPTAETLSWAQARTALIERGLLRDKTRPVAAVKWNEAGKLDLAVGDLAPVMVLSTDAREFAYRYDPAQFVGRDVLILARDHTLDGAMDDLRPYFRSITPLEPIRLGRGGRTEITLGVALGHDLLRPYPAGSAR